MPYLASHRIASLRSLQHRVSGSRRDDVPITTFDLIAALAVVAKKEVAVL